jgi:hypothetical protein
VRRYIVYRKVLDLGKYDQRPIRDQGCRPTEY